MLAVFSYSLPYSFGERSSLSDSPRGFSVDEELSFYCVPLSESEYFSIASIPGASHKVLLRPLTYERVAVLNFQNRLLFCCKLTDLNRALNRYADYLQEQKPIQNLSADFTL